MFGLFKRKSSDKWDMLMKEFSEITQSIRGEGKVAQIAVGHGINTANSFFNKSFSDISSFQKLPETERVEYIKKLGMTVEKIAKKDMHTAVGFRLFQMWLVAKIEGNTDAENIINKELVTLSKIGNLSGI
jgi:hypothetical protein